MMGNDEQLGEKPSEILVQPIEAKPTETNKKKHIGLAPRKKRMVEAMGEELGIVTSAAKKVGIRRETHYDWMENDSEYRKAIEGLKGRTEDVIEKAFLSLVLDKNPAAVIHAVKTKLKHKGYGETQALEITNTDMNIPNLLAEINNEYKRKSKELRETHGEADSGVGQKS